MIFVTVGTHEQQFNRLISSIDILKEKKVISEEVFIQRGYSDYIPRFCKSKKFLDIDEMDQYTKKANLVITHGGPSSFLKVISMNKPVIIVPRRLKYKEHINDHQQEFLIKLHSKGYKFPMINNIDEIGNLINTIISTDAGSYFKSNNKNFNNSLRTEISKIFKY
ncbi:MAG TPA: multidrug MFS transporter [Enterococcus sp.]|nr:multidrug MFS transporter [Enterococcus sp.]